MTAPLAASPVAFAVDIRRLPSKGMPVRIEAGAEQRAALATAHELESVDRFVADLLVEDWKRGGIRVTGRVEADIVQACIVTLDPVPAHIHEPLEALFVPEGSKLAAPRFDQAGEMILSADGPDAPEPFSGDTIDVGALAEEFFGMAIDPYPRAASATGSGPVVATTGGEDAQATSPFAKLRGLVSKE